MRVFVAVWPDQAVLDVVAAFDRPDHPGVRWTTPDQWHVTLRFCGSVVDDDLPDLVDALTAGLMDQPPETAVIGPLTSRFGASVLHVPVAGLDELGSKVQEASASFGDAEVEHDFHGHLTLARARRRGKVPGSLAGLPLSATWPVTEVAVVSSTPQPGGHRYRTEATIALVGRPH